ncbi:MAG: hypothetical protein Q7K71_04775 [Candidatus Omnitrophota bacterium]|nr:hypothetical protein [Candidatus Omnitrophota bacterium]
MKTGLVVFMLAAAVPLAWGQDDQGYDAMKDFIRQEDDRLKDIKLLSLDLEKADLEFKKKEIQAKMAGLSGTVAQDKGTPAPGGLPDIRVSGIVIKEGVGHAFISVEGRIFYVREGQDIEGKMKITKITDQAVFIQYPDGRTRSLEWAGG